jgi:hypothetical protein
MMGSAYGIRFACFSSGCRHFPRRVKRLIRGESGATLPEMLIMLVLIASAASLIGTAVYQLFLATSDGNARLTALHNLQNASIWLGRDASESQSFSAGAGSVYGTFTTGDPTVEYRYSYDASDGDLVREHLISGTPQSTLRVARGIADQGDIVFSLAGELLTVSITTTSPAGAIDESATLKLAMRVR